MRPNVMILVGVLAFGGSACQDMDVVNVNNPSRESVLESPADVEALISATFRGWFERTGGTTPGIAMSVMADEFTTGFGDFAAQELSLEPRPALNPFSPNNPTGATWADYYGVIAGVNTAIRTIRDNDMVIRSGGQDVTARAVTFGQFMQGLSHGQLALIYDRGYVVSDVLDMDTLRFGGGSTQVHELLRPYTEVRDTAIAQLEEALRLAQANPFTLPGDGPEWIPGITMSNDDLARLIHTYIARLMVYTARSSEERAAVDWNEVIAHIDQGIQNDFAPVGIPDRMESLFKHRAARLRTTTPADFMRVDYRLIGHSDLSQGFIDWANQPWSNREPFRMEVGDVRVDGLPDDERPSTCSVQTTSCGLYMGYHVATVFAPDRGTGQRSYYVFHRWGTGTEWQAGPIPIINVAELDLLKAEGLIRLGRADEAVPLINKTRVANGRLPPVTVDGVPGVAPDCVPRKYDGECGSLWDALRYEKRIETLGLEGGPAFYDARGWQTLVENTLIHFPMPLIELELLEMPVYTHGGGQAGSAPAANPEVCPVALPRCPN